MARSVQELAEIVTSAKQATTDLEGSELHRVAFERVLDHLLGNGDAVAAGSPEAAAPDQAAMPSADGVFADQQQRVDAVSRYFDIRPEDVGHIFDTSGEEPVLQIHTGSLSDVKAEATREITLLVGGARTALGQDTETSQIREIVDNYGKLDSCNFIGTLVAMSEISVLGKRDSPNRLIRMKVHGAEKAQTLAQHLIGD